MPRKRKNEKRKRIKPVVLSAFIIDYLTAESWRIRTKKTEVAVCLLEVEFFISGISVLRIVSFKSVCVTNTI